MAGVSLTELLRAHRYRNTATDSHQNFSMGMVRDVPTYLLSDGMSYDAVDMLVDKGDIARMRGGTTNVASSNTNAVATNIANINALQVNKTTTYLIYNPWGINTRLLVYAYNRLTGATTQLIDYDGAHAGGGGAKPNQTYSGRPFQHLGHLIVPAAGYLGDASLVSSGISAIGGATGGVNAGGYTTAAVTATLTAGSSTVTLSGAPALLANVEVGMYFVSATGAGLGGSGGNQQYLGRVSSVISNTAFTVTPTPTITGVSGAVAQVFLNWLPAEFPTATKSKFNGRVGCSYQNRILLGNIQQPDTGVSTFAYYPQRLTWGILQNESLSDGSGTPFTGEVQLQIANQPSNNFIDMPGQEPIQAVVPAGEGNLLILGLTRSFKMTGYLQTQTASTTGVSIDLHEIPSSIGAYAGYQGGDASVQRTPRGIVFASNDGWYGYDGVQMKPLLYGRNANYWRDLVRNSSVTIYGSALIRGNHYYLSTDQGGLLLNLDNLALTRIQNNTMKIFGAVQDYVDPSRTYAARWWNTGGAAPSMTNGQVHRIETIFTDGTAGGSSADGDTTTVAPQIITRAFPEGELGGIKRFTFTVLEVDYRAASGTCNVEATTDLSIDGSTSWTSLGSISPSTDSQTLRLPINLRGNGVAFRLTPSAATNRFEVMEIDVEYQPTRPGRMT